MQWRYYFQTPFKKMKIENISETLAFTRVFPKNKRRSGTTATDKIFEKNSSFLVK